MIYKVRETTARLVKWSSMLDVCLLGNRFYEQPNPNGKPQCQVGAGLFLK